MKTYHWDHEAMKAETSSPALASDRRSPQGMINVDSSEFVKKGKNPLGFSRQYCGAIGKVENCQSGVFVGYSSKKGYGLLTSRLLYAGRSGFPRIRAKTKRQLGAQGSEAFNQD